jgi:hypothetical protein
VDLATQGSEPEDNLNLGGLHFDAVEMTKGGVVRGTIALTSSTVSASIRARRRVSRRSTASPD